MDNSKEADKRQTTRATPLRSALLKCGEGQGSGARPVKHVRFEEPVDARPQRKPKEPKRAHKHAEEVPSGRLTSEDQAILAGEEEDGALWRTAVAMSLNDTASHDNTGLEMGNESVALLDKLDGVYLENPPQDVDQRALSDVLREQVHLLQSLDNTPDEHSVDLGNSQHEDVHGQQDENLQKDE
ncbi:hypothetical protein P171DRAFT_179527 [Karstenula rhodostoma CBS 690.94]|uniref:Uncharacterized protein n=1 Tax=Karstenula rhodostoma CBS 690.94 TaxID=1392251 RepID=A0A9P4P5A4_9PLEO|nr:hypothetical protein P171DRAFT_179527 [Karstenula rhodostoma CBS 690.94]